MNLTTRILCGLLLTLVSWGCYSMMPVERSPEDLRAEIHAGRIFRVGDEVVITTRDGQSHEFVISEITAEQVRGPEDAVDIDEITAAKRLEYDREKVGVLLMIGQVVLLVAITGYIFKVLTAFP